MIGISHQLLLKQSRRRWRLVWTTCISRWIIIEFHEREHLNVKDLSCCCEATPRKASFDWRSCWLLCICTCHLRLKTFESICHVFGPNGNWKPIWRRLLVGHGLWAKSSKNRLVWSLNQMLPLKIEPTESTSTLQETEKRKVAILSKLVLELYQGLSLPVLMLHRHEMPWVPLPTTWCLKHAFYCTLCIWIFRNLAFCLGRKRVAGRGRVPKITWSCSYAHFQLEPCRIFVGVTGIKSDKVQTWSGMCAWVYISISYVLVQYVSCRHNYLVREKCHHQTGGPLLVIKVLSFTSR